MNHTPAPQTRRVDGTPRVAGDSPLLGLRRDVPREALEDAELFQSLVAPFIGEAWPWPMPPGGVSEARHADGFTAAPASASTQAGTTAGDLSAWETLVRRLDEHLTGVLGDRLEATFELPRLGAVAVQVLTQAKSLDITVRFAQSEAWQCCQRGRDASRERLSQRLGRRVNLTFDSEKP